ncbi:hypothetical protein COV21_02005 [Candidatus Woesearchaeota archaeon CG10_big_fil_rev_8_21_14_0_10_45_5]|nr:MAG: hypothetical protein COV21_02005 [Candidatus Woesearchaeota archaeon CG10_big_fil_rev_8_21_14_0_10_45_5]PIU30415.1 MAG: hypothetical protein COT07_00860 [Candidatus Woesearchaeota archaeon CG07_land_8_20_14_0_80_44_23]
MENYLNLELIEKNESLLEGRIFTAIQLNTLKKKLQKKHLNSNEKTYYYKFIKPKIRAMMAFFNINEINVNGKEFIKENKLEEAIKIIHKLEQKHKGKKIILSGSFLFNKEYNDIDVFVFSKYDKEDYQKGKVHVTFLPESALQSLFFSSLCKISISNFNYTPKSEFDIELPSVLQTYELLVNAILNNEDYEKNLRDFILQTEYVSKSVILNPKQLYDIKEKLSRKNLGILSNTFINSLALSYTAKILKSKLKAQVNDYKKLLTKYKTAKNLPIYIDTYSKVISLANC